MPSRNIVKQYLEGGFYHIYNRGVEKRTIFEDDHDYRVFLTYLKNYLSPPNTENESGYIRKNYCEEVSLVAYCLMPNHFHLLIQQRSASGIEGFMRSIGTKYSMYFNRKYARVGGLFQDTYKAILVQSDEYLVHLTRYIHTNPDDIEHYPYSSYKFFLSDHPSWVNPDPILGLFDDRNSYQRFVEDFDVDSSKILGNLTLE